MEKYFIGTCDSMCPSDEIKLRTEQKLLHFFERKNAGKLAYEADAPKVVKEFARSAAGNKSPRSKDLRTPLALLKTVEYLLSQVIYDERKPFNIVYDFIFNRLRAVRQEIVMQNLSIKLTVGLMEPICMFLAYSLYKLIEEPIDKFDPKICRQHLQECLKKVLSCYDSIGEISTSPTNREIIESIYLLFNLGSTEALERAIRLPTSIRSMDVYQQCLQLSLAFWRQNYYKCLISVPKLPHLICAIASLQVQTMRREIIKCFSAGYQSKALTVPIPWLKKVLLFSSDEKVIQHLRYYGVSVEAKADFVRFSKSDFKPDLVTLRPMHEEFVDIQLKPQVSQYFMLQI